MRDKPGLLLTDLREWAYMHAVVVNIYFVLMLLFLHAIFIRIILSCIVICLDREQVIVSVFGSVYYIFVLFHFFSFFCFLF